jgi:hypothetical protein
VVAAHARHTDAHKDTPEDDEADNRRPGTGTSQGLSESCDNDENQLKTVHLLAANNIGQSAESELTNDSAGRCGHFNGRVLGCGERALVVHNTQHNGQQRYADYYGVSARDSFGPICSAKHTNIIRIGEEPSTGHQTGAYMVPAEGCLVDFGEGESAALVGVGYVGEIIVEVVEGVVPTCCFGSHGVLSLLSKLCQCWALVSRGDKRLWM